jgi:hypothetical protein
MTPYSVVARLAKPAEAISVGLLRMEIAAPRQVWAQNDRRERAQRAVPRCEGILSFTSLRQRAQCGKMVSGFVRLTIKEKWYGCFCIASDR